MTAITPKTVYEADAITASGTSYTYTCGGGNVYFHGHGVQVVVSLVHGPTWTQVIAEFIDGQDFVDAFASGDELEIKVVPSGEVSDFKFVLREV